MKKVKVLVIIREILIGILSYFVSLIVVILVIGNLPSLNYVDPKTGDLVINSLGALLILFIPLIFTILCIIFFRKLLKSKENKSSRISSTGSSPCYSLSHKESANDAYQQNLEKETVPRLKNNILTSEKSLKSKEEETNPLHTIKAMEDWFETNYKFARGRLLNAFDRQKFYDNMLKQLSHLDIPLIVKVRCEQLCEEYKIKFQQLSSIEYIDSLNGNEFEEWCADLLCKMSFQNIQVTGKSGDQGVDILSEKDGVKYAIQCKCYSTDLGNTPIQEVESGRVFYGCHVGVVMTNRYFTKGAKELAQKTGTLLWDRKFISNMVDQLGYTILDSKVESTTDQN